MGVQHLHSTLYYQSVSVGIEPQIPGGARQTWLHCWVLSKSHPSGVLCMQGEELQLSTKEQVRGSDQKSVVQTPYTGCTTADRQACVPVSGAT